MKYYKLLDQKNRGTIIRADGRIHHKFVNEEWVRSGLMTLYQSDESDLYDLYKKISEDEALKLIAG